ncbi:Rhodanese-like domain-containing protein [Mortierella sp. GBAus27b]|nr:Rhodanese-like domain-containing protein [Mortierella sp. GBAus27b]
MTLSLFKQPPLIDVRDQNEVDLGVIPTAHHIALAALGAALALSDDQFKEQYKFDKFAKDDEVIFYCRSGRRSKLAYEQARELGYTGVRHYPGSWNEWSVRYPAEQ